MNKSAFAFPYGIMVIKVENVAVERKNKMGVGLCLTPVGAHIHSGKPSIQYNLT